MPELIGDIEVKEEWIFTATAMAGALGPLNDEGYCQPDKGLLELGFTEKQVEDMRSEMLQYVHNDYDLNDEKDRDLAITDQAFTGIIMGIAIAMQALQEEDVNAPE
jgi:hypothetical protein